MRLSVLAKGHAHLHALHLLPCKAHRQRAQSVNLQNLTNTHRCPTRHAVPTPTPLPLPLPPTPQDKAELKDVYKCPVYTTEARFREEVFEAQLKSKHSEIKWVLAGLSLFLDVV